MELVYLWVEEYKNIKRQGFNFSPRFTCNYENGELTINENKEHVSIFPENINVTAIVGENGSGKSNILELLFNLRELDYDLESYFYVIEKEKEKKYFLYYFEVGNLTLVKTLDLNKPYTIKKISEEDNKEGNTNNKFDFHAIYFSNLHLNLPSHDNTHEKKFHNITTSYLINKFSKDLKHDKFIDYEIQYNLFFSKSIENVLIMLSADIQIPFELPKKLDILNKVIDTKIKEKLQKRFSKTLDFSQSAKLSVIANYCTHSKNEDKKSFIKECKKIKTIDDCYEYIKKKVPIVSTALDDFLEELSKNNSRQTEDCTSIDLQKENKNFIEKLQRFNKSRILTLNKVLDIFDFLWSPNLSTGQETYLFQFANLYNAMQGNMNKYNNYLILIDEGENALHPNWQKSYVKYYVEFLEKNFKEKNIQLVFSTHSPFILSDLPKDNVIFLEKGVQKYPFKDNQQTFGANIHTLLSHGFFMKDGLMGEFAKGKINKIIEFHKKVEEHKKDETKKEELKTEYEKKKKKFWHIQSIIGEDYLKQVIKNHLVEIEKILLGKDGAKKEEIARLQKQLKLLEKEDD